MKLFNSESLPVRNIVTTGNVFTANEFRNGAFKNGYYIEPELITDTSGLQLKKINTDYSLFTDDLTKQFHSPSTKDKCKQLAEILLLTETSLEESITDEALARNVERFRIYNHCFLQGNIKLTDILPNESIKKLTSNLFPYMSTNILFNKESSNIIQKYDLKTKQESSIQFHDDHLNLFQNWVKKNEGKGIITTMSIKEIDFFLRLVKVLDKLDNKLPIEIVVTTQEDYNDFKRLLEVRLQHSKQHIQILNVSYILNDEYVNRKINGYMYKWIATLFNTFEEFIFIDADVVPFQSIMTFFDIPEYKQNGLYLYRDRNIGHAKLEGHCKITFFNLEPTTSEYQLIGTKWLFNLESSSSNSNDKEPSIEQNIYNSFFNDGVMHQVDSGIVIMRKTVENYGSLLMSLQLNMAEVLNDCVHGDKEYFWLGPLILGNHYNIDPTRCGAVGSVYEESTEDNDIKRLGICSTQIGHCDADNSLLWLNGGAKLCKSPNAAVNDFKKDPEFMAQRYENVNHLSEIYNSALFIDGMIIPDIKQESMQWMQTRECSQYRFCAYIDIPKDNPNIVIGNVIKFDQKQISSYNEISNIWSQDMDE